MSAPCRRRDRTATGGKRDERPGQREVGDAEDHRIAHGPDIRHPKPEKCHVRGSAERNQTAGSGRRPAQSRRSRPHSGGRGKIGDQPREIELRARPVGGIESLVELGDVEAALRRGVAQTCRTPLPLSVGRQHREGHVQTLVGHGVAVDGMELFWSLVRLHGGPAPVRRFLPELIDLIWNRQIDPGKVFDLRLPLDQAAAGYQAMDQREAIKVLLHP